jgi:hypothetical protein
MTGQQYSYPDKLGFGETLMFHIRVMSSELAEDGLDNEFEDLVDMAGWLIRPYLSEDEWEEWEEVSQDDLDVLKEDDSIKWGKAKRRRCEGKMRLIMKVMQDNGLLLKRVSRHEPDMEYYNELGEGNND